MIIFMQTIRYITHMWLFTVVMSHERRVIPNCLQLDCLLNCSSIWQQRKRTAFALATLWEGNSPVTGGFPSQSSSNTEVVSMSCRLHAWWRHQMETFSALLALCAGKSSVPAEFPPQRPVTWSFDIFFDLCLNKRLSKQSWGWWFETPSRSLCRHCNGFAASHYPTALDITNQ